MGANEVVRNVWQGDAPPAGMHPKRWRHLYLCADEYQPPASLYPGMRVHRCPLDDSLMGLSRKDLDRAIRCGLEAARHASSGEPVLVTCAQGRNRSGLVSAVAVRAITGLSSREAIMLVRRARGPHALSNPAFVRYLEQLDEG